MAKNDLFYRNFELSDDEVRAITVENRAIDLSFSSEMPVQRWYGIEILSHNPGAIVRGRAKAILFNHNPDRIIGKFSNESYEEGKGRGRAGFDETDEGNLALSRVQSGSLRGVSVGYSVEKFRKLQPGEEYKLATGTIKGREDIPVYIAEKWSPREISLTPIPADHTVGIGRDATRSLDGIEIEEGTPPVTADTDTIHNDGGQREMDEKEVTTRIDDAVKAAVGQKDATMKKVFDRAAAAGQEALAFRLFAEGKSEDEITDAIIAAQAKERGNPTNGGEGEEKQTNERKLEDIDDETFVRSLTNPTVMVLD
ncbi:MAG: Caudovirus prohead protease [Syntrophorhabdus sp. PtaU1.Bin153]|nr:MAG: Caudovirus prohead protease [Syntrophorhabdus sp. PtaU1.Bin153]